MQHLFDAALLNEDHAELDGLFGAVAVLPPDDLPACARRIARTLTEHFAREEAAMAAAGFPGLTEHRAMHAALLAAVREVADLADTFPRALLGTTLGSRIPALLAHHEAVVDGLTQDYLDHHA